MKTKTHTYRISGGRNRIKLRVMTDNIAGACVWNMRIESSTYVTACNLIVFGCFNVDSRKPIKAVVWTWIDRCVFDDKEKAYFWKRISVDRALNYLSTLFYLYVPHVCCRSGLDLKQTGLVLLPLFCCSSRKYFLLERSYNSGIWFHHDSNTNIQMNSSLAESWKCILSTPCHELILSLGIVQQLRHDTSGIAWTETK